MSVNNIDEFIESIWDWGFLDKCFTPTKIRFGDLDAGVVERNHHTLIIEGKRSGVPLPRGQEIMYQNHAATGLITTIVTWGESRGPNEYPTIKRLRIYRPRYYAEERGISLVGDYVPATREDLEKICTNWFHNYAEKRCWLCAARHSVL